MAASGILKRAVDAALEILMHGFILAVWLGVIWLVEYWLKFLWAEDGHKFWGKIPMEWLFDAGDIAGIITFFILGIQAAAKAYKGEG